MRKTLLSLFIFLSVTICAQDEVLTNQSIIDMIELGFSEDVIITKISTSENNFDASIEALKALKEKGVSSPIIVALMNANNVSETLEKQNTLDRIGIYVEKSDKLEKILPTAFSGSKTNTLASALSYGLASTKIKAVIASSQSRNVIDSNIPEFYFYFKKRENDHFAVGASNWWFFSATSPNEFTLIKLKKKKNSREITTGSVNLYAGTSMGADEKSIIKFKIETIDEYTYKVITENVLEPGEYCFFYQGTIPSGGDGASNQSVFDFSIPENTQIIPKYEVDNTIWVLKDGKPFKLNILSYEIKRDGTVYYKGENWIRKTVHEYPEPECYSSKQKLINAKGLDND